MIVWPKKKIYIYIFFVEKQFKVSIGLGFYWLLIFEIGGALGLGLELSLSLTQVLSHGICQNLQPNSIVIIVSINHNDKVGPAGFHQFL